jgi:acetoin utilization deacetylase AcuC-like enzyme
LGLTKNYRKILYENTIGNIAIYAHIKIHNIEDRGRFCYLLLVKKVGFFYDDVFLKHKTPPGHPESPERLKAITGALGASPLHEKIIHEKPRPATPEEIMAVHERLYVEKMRSFTGYADPDTYISEGTYEAALHAAGAVLGAARLINEGTLERAFCAVRPPGHHAEKGRAMGFCVFNNIAVGARGAQGLGYKKIFIIDFDVHHGNGTQQIFYEDPDVFYFSTHQYPFYPGTGSESEAGAGEGKGTTYNVPMQAGSGVKQYFRVYQDILPPLVDRFAPDMIMVSAGYDIYTGDPLASINVSKEGLRGILKGILSASKSASKGSIPLIFSLEGGYDTSALGELVLLTLEELLYS